MRLRTFINPYVIRRDHSRRFGFFVVHLAEYNHYGLGFQFPAGPYVIGLSVGYFPWRGS